MTAPAGATLPADGYTLSARFEQDRWVLAAPPQAPLRPTVAADGSGAVVLTADLPAVAGGVTVGHPAWRFRPAGGPADGRTGFALPAARPTEIAADGDPLPVLTGRVTDAATGRPVGPEADDGPTDLRVQAFEFDPDRADGAYGLGRGWAPVDLSAAPGPNAVGPDADGRFTLTVRLRRVAGPPAPAVGGGRRVLSGNEATPTARGGRSRGAAGRTPGTWRSSPLPAITGTVRASPTAPGEAGEPVAGAVVHGGGQGGGVVDRDGAGGRRRPVHGPTAGVLLDPRRRGGEAGGVRPRRRPIRGGPRGR